MPIETLKDMATKRIKTRITTTTTTINSDKIKSIILSSLNTNNNKRVILNGDSTVITSTAKSVSTFLLNQDLALIIAIVSGASVVLISVNIFCVWNYYSKKLRQQKLNEIQHNSSYRTSTMIRTKNTIKSNSSTGSQMIDSSNRTITSTVESYSKVPGSGYDPCNKLIENPPIKCESPSSSLSSSNSSDNTSASLIQSSVLTSEFLHNNEKKIEFLKNYFTQNRLVTSNANEMNVNHYYETLSTRNNNNYLQPYSEYQCMNGNGSFEHQIVLLPASQIINSETGQSQTILLLAASQQQQLMQQQQYSTIYGDVSPSSSSIGSNKPLLTFVNNNNSNINN
jgi:hypothetical protein